MDASAPAPTSRVIIGLDWAQAAPRVRFRNDGAVESRLEPLVGLRLNYKASVESVRQCLGHTPFRKTDADYVDCVNSPQPGSRKCRQCSIIDATFASNLHHAHTKDRSDIDPAVADHLRQPNLLYLAAFRDGSIKVGTTTEKRRLKRLAEQGAWRAKLVARAEDGYVVRVIEDAVTTGVAVPQSVSIARKLDGMVSPRPDHILEASLQSATARVRELVAAHQGAHSIDQAWEFRGSVDPIWQGLHRYPLRLDTGAHDTEVLGACGRVVVLARPGQADTFVADLAQLFGVELALGAYQSDELAVQDSLF